MPLDVQTWSWLAARQAALRRGARLGPTNLVSTDTPLRTNSALTGNDGLSGVVFASGSLLADPTTHRRPVLQPEAGRGAVWLEGTAQLALALPDGRQGADRVDAAAGHLASAQGAWAGPEVRRDRDGGVVAASSPLDTGFGFGYFPNLHVGATSWFVMASLKANPYRFL